MFDRIRALCRDIVGRQGCSVALTEADVRVTPERGARHDYGPGDGVHFRVLVHLLNFGHGYRHELHRHHGIGAWETMKRGAVRLGKLRPVARDEVGELFFGTPSPPEDLRPLQEMIVRVLRETWERAPDLEALVAPCRTAAEVVETLARTIPAFDDPFRKKAQIAAREIGRWPDEAEMTVACDNVIPCVLRAMGAIRLDPDLAARIDRCEPLPAGRREMELRAASILAGDRIARGVCTPAELGDCLWALGKDPKYRRLERHATKETVFY